MCYLSPDYREVYWLDELVENQVSGFKACTMSWRTGLLNRFKWASSANEFLERICCCIIDVIATTAGEWKYACMFGGGCQMIFSCQKHYGKWCCDNTPEMCLFELMYNIMTSLDVCLGFDPIWHIFSYMTQLSWTPQKHSNKYNWTYKTTRSQLVVKSIEFTLNDLKAWPKLFFWLTFEKDRKCRHAHGPWQWCA